MISDIHPFTLRLAESAADVAAAQRLRYEVFVAELGGTGAGVDHAARRECDRFDDHGDHLLLIDEARPPERSVVGVYRLLRKEQARAAGGFYSEGEYDLGPLRRSGRSLLELGRSCLHPDVRGGAGLHQLWSGLADYVTRHGVDLLFGVASFHGTDIGALAAPLSLLHHRHLAPESLRVRSRAYQPMDMVPPEGIDRLAAMRATPALIKGYLRLGGVVGDGAFIDRTFNTTDVCLIMDTAAIGARQRELLRARA